MLGFEITTRLFPLQVKIVWFFSSNVIDIGNIYFNSIMTIWNIWLRQVQFTIATPYFSRI